ncbi:hypothetical protein FSPOR_4513 [Fusarium sporotrichioides]|uniref:Uncharacterized protein n=1 Tax=Fusarium sporotrichioides TaxID=5514 RepID=A0A395SBC2_FUSSP|nr:hypothetical protein FSPOR_4513 [Fusarium sporotrichioides]
MQINKKQDWTITALAFSLTNISTFSERLVGWKVSWTEGDVTFQLSVITIKIKQKWKDYRQRVPPRRPPLLLTIWGMALQLLCQIAIIITIGSLWHISNTHNGIARVGDDRDPSFDSKGFHPPPILSSSIVWATVPAWIMSAYSSLWSAMLDALKKVQPLLELEKANQKPYNWVERWNNIWKWLLQRLSPSKKSSGPTAQPSPGAVSNHSTVDRTLLLDYGEWPVINGLRAIRKGHVILGICLILRAALWTAGGLTAAMFAVVLVPAESQASLRSTHYFDEYLGWASGIGSSNSSLTPALDLVSATVLRDGEDYPWTTDTHSFLPYLPVSWDGPGNYSFDTEAYSATVECDVTTEEDLARVEGIRSVVEEEDDLNSSQLQLGFQSGGCNVEKSFLVTNNTLLYARTWQVDCNLGNGRARLGMFSGVYNSTAKFRLSNLSVITCQPLIYKSRVTLNMSFSNNTREPKIISVSERHKQRVWPFFLSGWLRNIPLYSVFDPTVYNDMDTFSRLVIGHASGKPILDDLPEKDRISTAFETVFAALFSNFVTLQAYSSSPAKKIIGTLSRLERRLFVVEAASAAIVAIIVATLVTTIVLAAHLYRQRHILERYLDLMLGTALLLRDASSSGLEIYLEDLI